MALKTVVPLVVKVPPDFVQGVDEPVTVIVTPLSLRTPFERFIEPILIFVEPVKVVEPLEE